MNSLWSLFGDPLAQRWAVALVHFLWQGLAVAAVYLALLPLVQRRSAAARYAWGLLCLTAMATAPLLTLAFVSPLARSDPEPTTAAVALAAFDESTASAELDFSPGVNSLADAIVTGESYTSFKSIVGEWQPMLAAYLPWILVAWLAGVLLLAARLAVGGVTLLWLRATADALPDEWLERAEAIRRRLGATSRVMIRTSTRVSEALAAGLIRPMILIPACWLTELSPAMLEAVLAHELAHIRRHDLWVNFAQRFVETVLFYHPAVWWLSRRVRREREKCCDALAISATGSAVQYAQTLEHLAARRLSGSLAPSLAAGIGEDKMYLLDRVRNILGITIRTRRTGLWPVGILLLFLATGGWLASSWTSSSIADEAVAADEDHDEGHENDHDEGHDHEDGHEHGDEDEGEHHEDGHDEDDEDHHADHDDRPGDDEDGHEHGGDDDRDGHARYEGHNGRDDEARDDLLAELAELRKTVDRQNRIIQKLTARLDETTARPNPPATLDRRGKVLPLATSYPPPAKPDGKSPKIVERRRLHDGKEVVVIERAVMDGDRPRVVRETQVRQMPSRRPVQYAQSIRNSPANADYVAESTAALEQAHRKLRETQKRLEVHEREFDVQRNVLRGQLDEIRGRIARDDRRYEETTKKDEVRFDEELAAHQQHAELEFLRREIQFDRRRLEHQREKRRAEHELAELEGQLEELAGEKKREAARRISDLRVVVETAAEELDLMKREQEIEIRLLRALAEREQTEARRKWKAEQKTIGSADRARLSDRRNQIEVQMAELEQKEQVAKARIEHEIAEIKASLKRLEQQQEEPKEAASR